MAVTMAVAVLALHFSGVGVPCGRFREVCGESEYCDAGLRCAHCAFICDSLTGLKDEQEKRENLEYACNTNCPGYLTSKQTTAFSSTAVPTTHTLATSLPSHTSLLPSTHPPQEPTVHTGVNREDSSGQVHMHTALLVSLVVLVVIILVIVIFVYCKRLKNKKEAQNPMEGAVQQRLVDHPPDNVGQREQQGQTEQVGSAAIATAPTITQPALVCDVSRESQNVPQVSVGVNREPGNIPQIHASVSVEPQNVQSALDDGTSVAAVNNRSDRQTQCVQVVQRNHSQSEHLHQEMIAGPPDFRNRQSQKETTDQSATCAKEPVQTTAETRPSNQTAYSNRTSTCGQSLASSGYKTSSGQYVCTPVEDNADPS